MHVLQVSPYFPPTWSYGGIPRIVDGLSRSLVRKGVRVSVVTTDAFDQQDRSSVPRIREYHGLSVYTLPNLSNHFAYRHQLFLPLFWNTVQRHFWDVDIVHLHGHRHLLNNLAVRLAVRQDIPYVLTANGTLRRHERKIGIKWIWDQLISGHIPKQAEKCIAVSPMDVIIHQQSGIAKDRIEHIANGLDLAEFSPLPPRGFWRKKLGVKEKLIVYLGQISPRKGVSHLVQAFLRSFNPNVSLAIAGNDSGALAEAKRWANDHPNIHFLGTVNGQQRVQLLADADLLVYPSTNEIFGLAPFEGLLCGVPVIVGDDCGCGQIIGQAQAGLLVAHGDIPSLTQKMNTLLYDTTVARAMVQRGRQYIQQHLQFDSIADKHLDLYHRVCNQYARKSSNS